MSARSSARLALLAAALSGCGGNGGAHAALVREPAPNVAGPGTPAFEPAPQSASDDADAFGDRGPLSPRKGLQLVLLHRYKPKSMENLTTVVLANKGCEIAFEPFLGSSGGSFGNASALAGSLEAAHKAAVFVVQFGFHSGGGAGKNDDDPSLATLETRGRTFYTSLFKAHPSMEYVLIPSLEDEWGNSKSYFKNAAEAVLKGFLSAGAADGKAKGDFAHIGVRRSSNTHPTVFDSTVNGVANTTKNGHNVVAFQISVKVGGEVHGDPPNDGSLAYSNDGHLVWYGPGEDADSMWNADNSGKTHKFALSTWKGKVGSRTKPVLLWRPAYNCYSFNVKNGHVEYINAELGSRTDSDSKPMFSDKEAEAARSFLGN